MYIRVTVTPNAKKESFAPEKGKENRFLASVREKAERNMANERVRELVAAYFSIPAGKVRLISGHRSPRKMFSVDMEDRKRV